MKLDRVRIAKALRVVGFLLVVCSGGAAGERADVAFVPVVYGIEGKSRRDDHGNAPSKMTLSARR